MTKLDYFYNNRNPEGIIHCSYKNIQNGYGKRSNIYYGANEWRKNVD